jgi:type I restriction-modification system DNA methylase subunit
MLGKIASAGQNGQFRTPRHIIRLMVELTAPQPTDVICDPACGTAGFLVAAGEVLRERHPNILHDAKLREHFHHHMFHGFDFDNTMLRIGSMNMLLHGVENPDIRYRDSLAQDHAGEEEKYTLVLANPPFAGSLDYENTAKDLLQIVKTKKTELLFLALFLRLLKPGGRAAVTGPHLISNGLLLRSDLHILFDEGYVTVTEDLCVQVSDRIKEEFENGREYYQHRGKPLVMVPGGQDERPAAEFLRWHNEHRYLG